MKSVLASFKPKYCELIASGKKTVEIRKTRPKIDVPFKCYMYRTKGHWIYKILKWLKLYQGKVIGEFVCDGIYSWGADDFTYGQYYASDDELNDACLTNEELWNYAKGKTLYAWHISKLVIYDKPKELSEFNRVCAEWGKSDFTNKCRKCPEYYVDYRDCSRECLAYGKIRLERPPQSWCYVEEVQPCRD